MSRSAALSRAIRRAIAALAMAGGVLLPVEGWSAATAPQADSRTPLQEAIQEGDEQRVRDLLAEGESPDEAMVAAARSGNVGLLEYLIGAGAEPESFSGARALAVAILAGQEEAQRFLVDRGADLEARDNVGRTVLQWAAGQRRLGSLARAAIGAGADLEATSRTGENPLMSACRSGRLASVRMLLKAGAEVEARDRDGWTPLMFAVRSGNLKVVDVLIDAGAEVEVESTLGWTPLMIAAWDGKARIVSRLLRAGADPNHRTTMSAGPLVRSIQAGHPTVVRRLLARGAAVGSGEAGDPLWWARQLGRRRLGKLLVSALGDQGV